MPVPTYESRGFKDSMFPCQIQILPSQHYSQSPPSPPLQCLQDCQTFQIPQLTRNRSDKTVLAQDPTKRWCWFTHSTFHLHPFPKPTSDTNASIATTLSPFPFLFPFLAYRFVKLFSFPSSLGIDPDRLCPSMTLQIDSHISAFHIHPFLTSYPQIPPIQQSPWLIHERLRPNMKSTYKLVTSDPLQVTKSVPHSGGAPSCPPLKGAQTSSTNIW